MNPKKTKKAKKVKKFTAVPFSQFTSITDVQNHEKILDTRGRESKVSHELLVFLTLIIMLLRKKNHVRDRLRLKKIFSSKFISHFKVLK